MGVQNYFGRNRLDFAPELLPFQAREAKKGVWAQNWEEGHAGRIHDGER